MGLSYGIVPFSYLYLELRTRILQKFTMNLSIKKYNYLFIFILIFVLNCSKNSDNPPLAKFDGGTITQNEYIDHYLLSTKYHSVKII